MILPYHGILTDKVSDDYILVPPLLYFYDVSSLVGWGQADCEEEAECERVVLQVLLVAPRGSDYHASVVVLGCGGDDHYHMVH